MKKLLLVILSVFAFGKFETGKSYSCEIVAFSSGNQLIKASNLKPQTLTSILKDLVNVKIKKDQKKYEVESGKYKDVFYYVGEKKWAKNYMTKTKDAILMVDKNDSSSQIGLFFKAKNNKVISLFYKCK
ncbi:MAG: hypothetical protein ABGX26_02165 [Nautiliaceae bacterium]